MPYRNVKLRSDRGSIRNLHNAQDEYFGDPTPEELELKKLYEYAQATKDKRLQDSLGFIVMNHPGDRAAFPISVYRHREYINSLSQERVDQIKQMKNELSGCFPTRFEDSSPIERRSQYKQIFSRAAIAAPNEMIKMAGARVRVKRSFRRTP